MSPANTPIERADVLDAFAVEADAGPETLARYLRDFPQFGTELVDLGRELGRTLPPDEAPLSASEQAMIDAAWSRHAAAAPAESATDPFSALSVAELRDVAQQLNIPRQVVTAFRERRVIVATVPKPFLARLANALKSTLDEVVRALAAPPTPTPARSYKADGKPSAASAVSFEQVLMDAGLSADRRQDLLKDGD